MTLSFDIIEDDYFKGQEHLLFKEPQMQRLLKTMYWFSAAVPLIVHLGRLLLDKDRHSPIVDVISGLTGAILMPLAIIGMLRLTALMMKPVSRVWMRRDINQAIGRHELELVPKGLCIRTPHGEQTVYWQSIGTVATTPEHTCIYLTRMQSVIVPQKRTMSGNYAAFMQAFADVYAARRDQAIGSVKAEGTPVAMPVIAAPAISSTTTEQRLGLRSKNEN